MSGVELTPPNDPIKLRSELRAGAPKFNALANQLISKLESGIAAINIKNFGVANFDVDSKRKILYALSVLMGLPSGTDPRERKVVWDVKNANKSGEYFATFSEHDGEAKYHTDTQYYPDPERYFLLYVVEPAKCGGGVSFLRNGLALKEYLQSTSEGRETVRILSDALIPFRIPSVFTKSGEGVAKEFTHTTIFGQKTFLRWRIDTILKGLEEHPELASSEVYGAVNHMARVMEAAPDEHRELMPKDSLSIIDNHVALHGRTGFQDQSRHLIRIRFHNQHPEERLI